MTVATKAKKGTTKTVATAEKTKKATAKPTSKPATKAKAADKGKATATKKATGKKAPAREKIATKPVVKTPAKKTNTASKVTEAATKKTTKAPAKTPAKAPAKAPKTSSKPAKPVDKTKKEATVPAEKSKVGRPKSENTKAAQKKHWFPGDAKAGLPAKPPAKKSPWQRKMVPINYGTIGGPVVNIKELFNKYIDDNHKKMTPEQRATVWQEVGLKLLGNDRSKLTEIIDQVIKDSTGSK